MTAPSEIDLALYEPEFDHALCRAEADLYGATFCLATRKPGPCAGTHHPGTILAPPAPVKIPAAPVAPVKNPGTDAGYQQAYLRAQQAATSAGLPPPRHAEIAGAMADYARALHGHQQAEAHADAAYKRAQGAHDSAEARQAARTESFRAREAAAEARDRAAIARANLHHAARSKAKLHAPPGFAYDDYGIPVDFQLYGLVSWAHHACEVGEFCRNPLHPGPCKGWKHMLHAVAPGAYHAYERQRVDKLNEKRLAKIKALQELGHPVPKHLLKEHTYLQVPKAPEGTPFQAPTPKEAASKLPATAKEIGEKIALKHASVSQAHEQAQADAFGNIVAALHNNPAGGETAKNAIQKFRTTLKPGQKLTDAPLIQQTAGALADMAVKQGGLDPKHAADIKQDILDHVEHGFPGLPVLVESAINSGKQKKQIHDAHQKLIDQHAATDWTKATGSARNKAYGQMGDILVHPDATDEQKRQAKDVQAKIAASLHDHVGEALAVTAPSSKAGPAEKLDKIGKLTKAEYEGLSSADKAKIGGILSGIHAYQPEHAAKAALVAKNLGIEHAFDAPPAKGGLNITVTNKIGEALKEATDKIKATGPLAHPDMMHVADLAKGDSHIPPSKLVAALQAPGVTKEEYDKLPSATQDKIKGLVAKLDDLSPSTAHGVKAKLGLATAGTEHYKGAQLDLAEALDDPKYSASETPGHFLNLAGDLSYNDVQGLSPEHKQKLREQLTDIVDKYGPNSVEGHEAKGNLDGWKPALDRSAAEVAAKKSAGSVTPAAPLGHDVAPHVKAAHSIATGATPATATKQVAAYSKLTPEEYHSLPQPVQAKIQDHLHAAHEKFLAPTKKQAVKDVLAKLGAPGEGAGAGAPHGEPAHERPVNVDKYVDAWSAVKALSTGSPLAAAGSTKHVAVTEHHVDTKAGMEKHSKMLAQNLSTAWSDKHLSYLPLSAHEKQAIRSKVHAEMIHMLQNGETHPPHGGVLATALNFPNGAEGEEEVLALKHAAGLPGAPLPGGAGAGGVAPHLGPAPTVPTDAKSTKVKTGSGKFTIKSGAARGANGDGWFVGPDGHQTGQWGKYGAAGVLIRHVDSDGTERFLMVQRGHGYDQAGQWQLGGGALDELENPHEGAARELHEEIGATPEYLASMESHGEHVFSAPGGWKYTSIAATAPTQFTPKIDGTETGDAKWLTRDEIAELDKQGKLVAPLSGGKLESNILSLYPKPTKAPKTTGTGTTPGLGKGTSTAKMTDALKDAIKQSYKTQPKGSSLYHDPADLYRTVLSLAHGYSAHHGSALSPLQVMKAIDEKHYLSLNGPGGENLEGKIKAWLATPEGKKAVKSITPDQALVDKIKAAPKPVAAPKPKLPTVVKAKGPGPYKATPASAFKAHTHSEMLALQDAYQAKHGKWTPAQRAAISDYTGSAHSINTYLRDGTHQGSTTAQHAADLQAAMIPLQEDALLMRGTTFANFPPGIDSYEALHKLVGKTFADKGFTSTAIAGESKGFSHKPVRLEIEAPKGTPGAYVEHVTSVNSEYEVILAAGTKFRVLAVKQEGGKVVVRVRVVS